MPAGYFITGTDTNVGKTWSSLGLMRMLQRQGLQVLGMKPVAAGCECHEGAWKNEDALLLQKHASVWLDYGLVNPYAFELAISPHLASGGVEVSLDVILRAFSELQDHGDLIVVEGAGGWLSPLDLRFDNADLAVALQLPVVMVVGMRLGCINHARLTYSAIRQAGLSCVGWISVQIDANYSHFAENLTFIRESIDAPLLGVLPYLPVADFDLLATLIKM